SHDLGLVGGLADRLAVMYAGYVVEIGGSREVLEAPQHPYTQGLLQCIPTLTTPTTRLVAIDGSLPDPKKLPQGCPFWPRCDKRLDPRCETELPPLRAVGAHHAARTFCTRTDKLAPEFARTE